MYEIVAKLGEGGMGEVYRARDTRLDREIALKVLPALFTSDSERIARFEREARVLALLNHSNIAQVYGFEPPSATAKQAAIAMELVEGPTLDELVRAEAAESGTAGLPFDRALAIARQIATALETAHEQGIIHRDLKPSNIKVREDGTVKVLDFGLAKAFAADAEAQQSAVSNSPTLTAHSTQLGMIIGTAAYMSPEQAKARPVDRRADVWAFGVVLFEMLAGRRAFEGDDVSDVLASVLKTEPDWSLLPADLPPPVRRLLRRCLEKDPKKRLRDVAEGMLQLDEGLAGGSMTSVMLPADQSSASATRTPLSRWGRIAAVAGTAAAAAGVLIFAGLWRAPAPPALVTRFEVPLSDGQQFTHAGRRVVALSPDGTNLVYVANQQLYLRPMSALEPRAIAGTPNSGGVTAPVFSPDGESVAFWSLAERSLKRVAISGGAAVTICPAENAHGLSWDEHGIVFADLGKGILRVPAEGGVPEVIAEVPPDSIADAPQMLPGGEAVLFSLRKTTEPWDKGQVVAQRLRTGERVTLVDGGADGRYLPTGHLAYAAGGIVFGVPFDAGRLTLTGGPVPLVEGVRRATGTAARALATAQFAFSANGTLAYLPGPASVDSGESVTLGIFDRKNEGQSLPAPPGSYSAPRVSPDGRWVAFEGTDGNSSYVLVYEVAGGSAPRRLTFEGNSRAPVWSADSKWIAFQSDRDNDGAIFRQRADGSGVAERLTKPADNTVHSPQSWAPNGGHLLFSEERKGDATQSTLWVLNLEDGRTSRFGDMGAREAVFSPDGKWVAYQTAGPSRLEVFVEPFPRTGAKYLVPHPGGHPMWSPKGDELFMNTGPFRTHAIGVRTTAPFTFGVPVELVRRGRGEPHPGANRRQADVMPDGRFIGVTTQAAGSGATQINIVLNWFEEVRQRVTGRR